MSDNTSNNRRIAKNTLFLYARMILVLIVGLYTSRVVLGVLGASDFGLYNVIAGFVILFSFLNTTLSSSLQRYYNFEGGLKGDQGFTNVFSVGFRVHALLAIVVFILLETGGLWYINNVMVVPENRISAANILYQLSLFSLIIIILQVPYSGLVIAKERMDFYAIISLVEIVFRLILVILLPKVPYDKLIAYSIIQLFITILSFVLYLVYTHKQFKFIHLTKTIDKNLLKSILSFSGLNLIGSFAFMLKTQGVNLILNAFFGTIVNAARGVASQISGAIMGFSSNISMSFKPQLVSSYAVGDSSRTFQLFLTQSKICYCLILMLITPVILEMNYLLDIWLGDSVPKYTNIFASLVLIDSMISTLNAPVTQVVYATGNIKRYQIYSAIVNFSLLPVCWLFMKVGCEPWVAFCITIVFSVVCQIVCLRIMHDVFEFSYTEYTKRIIVPCLIMTIFVPLIPTLITFLMHDTFLRLILVGATSILGTIIYLYSFFLSPSEKGYIRNFIKIKSKKESIQ